MGVGLGVEIGVDVSGAEIGAVEVSETEGLLTVEDSDVLATPIMFAQTPPEEVETPFL